jgi:hypothetical protein
MNVSWQWRHFKLPGTQHGLHLDYHHSHTTQHNHSTIQYAITNIHPYAAIFEVLVEGLEYQLARQPTEFLCTLS